MQTRLDLVDRSLAILKAGQSASGAFPASTRFPVYRYCWFRDGTFIAQALDLWDHHEQARRFYDWGVSTILANASDAYAAIAQQTAGAPARYLHTRYNPDGTNGDEDWPNFQLDGFGTFLWGMVEHLHLTDVSRIPETWNEAVQLLIPYLSHLWKVPAFDCWEEFPDKLNISTLCALYGGLHAVETYVDDSRAGVTAANIKSFVLDNVTEDGFLPKYVGAQCVDASLLWACVPFAVLDVTDPVMERTLNTIRTDLEDSDHGVHRYADDSYYGGGQWILLSALLAECSLLQGKRAHADAIGRWIDGQASPDGDLPEQVAHHLNFPEMNQPWIERWGPVASPLLWSHAAYLRLRHSMNSIDAT